MWSFRSTWAVDQRQSGKADQEDTSHYVSGYVVKWASIGKEWKASARGGDKNGQTRQ